MDFGTGDGLFAYRTAKFHPDVLVVGVDANADNLRDVSRRALQRPSRGGVPNVLFGRLALECAPGALSTLADRLTVLLPWGTLLRTVARPEPNGLARLANICREGAELRIVFGYGGTTDPKASEMDLPSLEETTALDHLELAYDGGGFSVVARHLSVADVATLPTTWAKKLAYSGKRRVFVEILGHCLRPTAWSR